MKVGAVEGVDGASLVTGIFSFGDMSETMWVGETAVAYDDGHLRRPFMLDIDTKKLFVCLQDMYTGCFTTLGHNCRR